MPVVETYHVVEIVAAENHEDGEVLFLCKESAEKYITESFAKGYFQYPIPIECRNTNALSRDNILPLAHVHAVRLEEWVDKETDQ